MRVVLIVSCLVGVDAFSISSRTVFSNRNGHSNHYQSETFISRNSIATDKASVFDFRLFFLFLKSQGIFISVLLTCVCFFFV